MEASGSIIVSGVIDGEDAVNYRLVVKPSGIICDTITGEVKNNSFEVEVWRHVGQGADEHVDDLSDYNLSIAAYAGGEMPDTSGEKRTAVITRGTSGEEMTNFDALRISANAVLSNLGKNTVEVGTEEYAWLNSCYEKAYSEWNADSSDFFSESTYPLVVNYRGENTEYYNRSYNAMQSWLMAMCLSELVPSKDTTGTLTNNQTELFKWAWDYANGDNTPIYGDFHVHADPMIARYAASMIYALMRGKKTFEEMQAMRSNLGGSYVDAYDSSSLGFLGGKAEKPSMVGYMVNMDMIIPDAPGPYAHYLRIDNNHIIYGADQKNRSIGGVPRVLPDDFGQFYRSSENTKYWWPYNYRKDVDIDNEMCSDYIFAVSNNDDNAFWNIWNVYSPEKKRMLMNAAVIPDFEDEYLYGGKKFSLDRIQSRGSFSYHFLCFKEDSNGLLVSGPFADFNRVMFNGGIRTSALEFATVVRKIADDCRYPIFRPEYSRRVRPLGAQNTDSAGRSASFGDPLNGFLNGTMIAEFKTWESEADKTAWINACDDWPVDTASSYPSGHAAQGWALAMMFGQMYSARNDKRIIQFAKNGYTFGVMRTVARFHWNSDVIFGRLCATMIMPIVNAMNGKENSVSFQSNYSTASTIITSGVSGGITFVIRNELTTDIRIKPFVRFVLRSGNETVRTGRIVLDSSADLLTIPAGGEYMAIGIPVNSEDTDKMGLYFATSGPKNIDGDIYLTNILLYDQDGYSAQIDNNGHYYGTYGADMSSDVAFTDNSTYTIVVNGTRSGYATKEENGTGVKVNVRIVNNSGVIVNSTGEVSFYVEDIQYGHVSINLKLPGYNQLEQVYTFGVGETRTFNGLEVAADEAAYVNHSLTGEAKVYDTDATDPYHNSNYITAAASTPSVFVDGGTYTINITGYDRP